MAIDLEHFHELGTILDRINSWKMHDPISFLLNLEMFLHLSCIMGLYSFSNSQKLRM